MKRFLMPLLLGLALGGLFPAMADDEAFAMPPDESLLALAESSDAFAQMIASASEEEAAMLIIRVISLMQAEGMEIVQIQQTVGDLFAKTAETRGADFGAAVVARVRKKVNPRLLPIIRMGGGRLPLRQVHHPATRTNKVVAQRVGRFALLALLLYPMWVTGGTRPEWQAPLPVLALLLLAATGISAGRALVKDPILYMGGGFVGLLLVQWANSDRQLLFDPLLRAWVYALPPVPWLPSSVSRPDAAEMVRWFLPAWAVALAGRHLFRDRREVVGFLSSVASAAALLAIAGVVQYLIAAYWGLGKSPANGFFVTSFGYANQAGSFFVMVYALCVGAALATHLRPHPLRQRLLALALAACCLLGVLVTFSRAAVLLAMGVSILGLLYFLLYRDARTDKATLFQRWVAAMVVVLVVGLVVYPFIGDAVKDELVQPSRSVSSENLAANWTASAYFGGRQLGRTIALRTIEDYPWFGAGGWAVRHLGVLYVPASLHGALQRPGMANTHFDLLQFTSEFGFVGMGVLLSAMVLMGVEAWRRVGRPLGDPRSVFTTVGLLAVLVHGSVDLPFRSPAVLLLFCLSLATLRHLGAVRARDKKGLCL